MFTALLRWSQQMPSLLRAGMPTSCALCGQIGRDVICSGCEENYFSHPTMRCRQCANTLPSLESEAAKSLRVASLCGDCLKQKRAFDASVVAIDYAAPADQLVLALKFGGQLALAPVFARMLRDAMLRQSAVANDPPTLLTAVPLGPRRLANRGFNQALEIARPLARLLNVPLHSSLIQRQQDTLPQMKLDPIKRRQNLRHAFSVSPKAMTLIRGRHVGVIDDVMTTGETLNELARTLKRCGAARVTNIVFARTLLK